MRTLTTDRLTLRPFRSDDEAIHELVFADPRVAREWAGGTRSLPETREWLRYRAWQARHPEDLGLLAVERRSDGALLGLVALQLCVARWLRWRDAPPFSPLEVEFSHAFGVRYAGHGYEEEAGAAAVAYAFGEMRLARLVSGVSDTARRLGFAPHPDLLAPEDAWVLSNG
jgi:ribosomal-protein-alanine N-acetyltransferase